MGLVKSGLTVTGKERPRPDRLCRSPPSRGDLSGVRGRPLPHRPRPGPDLPGTPGAHVGPAGRTWRSRRTCRTHLVLTSDLPDAPGAQSDQRAHLVLTSDLPGAPGAHVGPAGCTWRSVGPAGRTWRSRRTSGHTWSSRRRQRFCSCAVKPHLFRSGHFWFPFEE